MKRKNPYSSVDVNLISVESLTRQRAGQSAAVGVDVAKGELVLCVVWPDRSFERPWSVISPGQLRLAVGKLLELNRRCPVTVAMESSGTYGDCFRQALADAGLAVQRVSAKAVKDDSEGFDGVPSNHDGKDAAIIGTLCVNGRSTPWRWPGDAADESETDRAIRYQVRQVGHGPADQAGLVREAGRDAGAALAGGGEADEPVRPDPDKGAGALW